MHAVSSAEAEIEMLAQQENFDIMLITESWTQSKISNAKIILKVYDICRNNSEQCRGCGCTIYHIRILPFSEVDEKNSKLNINGIKSQ